MTRVYVCVCVCLNEKQELVKVSDSDECTKQAMLLWERNRRSRQEWSSKDCGGESECEVEFSL